MKDNNTKILMQIAVLAVAVGVVLAVVLIKSGYKSPSEKPVDNGFETTFTISDDGRTLNEELNGFTLSVPERWVAVESDVPNLVNLKPETANVACGIEVAHGKNATGSSATGFLNYYDPGNRGVSNTKDTLYELRDIQGKESAYLAWTEEGNGIRTREAYIPYQGYLMTARYWEDTAPDKVGQQPVPCIRTFDDLLETGIVFP